MIRQTLYVILCCIAALAVSSCERETSLDSGEKPQVVVECLLTDGPEQSLRLSFAKCPSEKKARVLDQAEVKLIDVTESRIVGNFTRSYIQMIIDGVPRDRKWELEYSGVPHHTYRLEIEVPGYDLIWAEETMPEAVEIEYVNINYHRDLYSEGSDTKDYFFQHHELTLTDDEVAGLPSHLRKSFVQGIYYLTESLPRNVIIYSMLYDKTERKYYHSDWICTDLNGTQDFNLTGDVYHGYRSSFRDEGKRWYQYIYPQLIGEELYSKHVLINRDEAVKGNKFFALMSGLNNFPAEWKDEAGITEWISSSFWGYVCGSECDCLDGPHDYYERESGMDYYVFESLTDDYYEYLKNSVGMIKIGDSTDYADFFIRDNIPSNIHGGIGILGASTSAETPSNRSANSTCGIIPES